MTPEKPVQLQAVSLVFNFKTFKIYSSTGSGTSTKYYGSPHTSSVKLRSPAIEWWYDCHWTGTCGPYPSGGGCCVCCAEAADAILQSGEFVTDVTDIHKEKENRSPCFIKFLFGLMQDVWLQANARDSPPWAGRCSRRRPSVYESLSSSHLPRPWGSGTNTSWLKLQSANSQKF